MFKTVIYVENLNGPLMEYSPWREVPKFAQNGIDEPILFAKTAIRIAHSNGAIQMLCPQGYSNMLESIKKVLEFTKKRQKSIKI